MAEYKGKSDALLHAHSRVVEPEKRISRHPALRKRYSPGAGAANLVNYWSKSLGLSPVTSTKPICFQRPAICLGELKANRGARADLIVSTLRPLPPLRSPVLLFVFLGASASRR